MLDVGNYPKSNCIMLVVYKRQTFTRLCRHLVTVFVSVVAVLAVWGRRGAVGVVLLVLFRFLGLLLWFLDDLTFILWISILYSHQRRVV
jgi:hypothetical protein